jgi:hypothetical protein
MVRRIRLQNEGEDGWSFDSTSVDQVIEAKLRREEIAERQLRRLMAANASADIPQSDRLGLSSAELDAIWFEIRRKFFEDAKLSETLRQQRQSFREKFLERVEQFRKCPQRDLTHVAKGQGALLAIACERAVTHATGEFADMLTQAVIARRGRKDFPLGFRTEIWRECLCFANTLGQWKNSSFWVDLAWGHDPHESPLPHLYRLETVQEQQAAALAFSDKFRPEFEDRMRHGSPLWLDEAERRISLRCLFGTCQRV